MTVHKSLSITCDFGGQGTYTCTTPEYFAGPDETAQQARAFLRTLGWRYMSSGQTTDGRSRDLCPEHAGRRKP